MMKIISLSHFIAQQTLPSSSTAFRSSTTQMEDLSEEEETVDPNYDDVLVNDDHDHDYTTTITSTMSTITAKNEKSDVPPLVIFLVIGTVIVAIGL